MRSQHDDACTRVYKVSWPTHRDKHNKVEQIQAVGAMNEYQWLQIVKDCEEAAL
jgi:hypothetical protein